MASKSAVPSERAVRKVEDMHVRRKSGVTGCNATPGSLWTAALGRFYLGRFPGHAVARPGLFCGRDLGLVAHLTGVLTFVVLLCGYLVRHFYLALFDEVGDLA